MPGTAVESLPGGLLDRLAATGDPNTPVHEIRRLCAAGAAGAALRAVDGLDPAVRATATVIAWRHFAWHSTWLALPEGAARPMVQMIARMLERPPRPRAETVTDAETWIVGQLITGLRDTRAMLTPNMRGTGAALAMGLQDLDEARSALDGRADLLGHLDLMVADTLARAGQEQAAWERLHSAVRSLGEAGDTAGVAAATVFAGDLLAAPLTSPIAWNCLLVTDTRSPDNSLIGDIEAAEFTGSPAKVEQARAAYEEAGRAYAALGDDAGIAVVKLRQAYLAMLEGRAAEAVAGADEAGHSFLAAGRPLDAAVAGCHRTLAMLADGRLDSGHSPAVDEATVGAATATGIALLYTRLGRHWAAGRPEVALRAFEMAESIFADVGEAELRAKALFDTSQIRAAVGDLPGAKLAAMAAMQADGSPLPEPPDPTEPRRAVRFLRGGRLYVMAARERDLAGMELGGRVQQDALGPVVERMDALSPMQRMVAGEMVAAFNAGGQRLVALATEGRAEREAGRDARAAELFAAAAAALAALPADLRDFFAAIVAAARGDNTAASDAFETHLRRALDSVTGSAPDLERRMLRQQGLLFQLNVGHAVRARAHFDALHAAADPWWTGLDLAWHARHQQARLVEMEGDLTAAGALIDEALAEVEQLRGSLSQDAYKAGLFGDTVLQDVYRDGARIALQRGDNALAFGYVERARGRALLDLMTANGGVERAGLPPDLVARWRAATAAVTLAQDRLAWQSLRRGATESALVPLRYDLAAARERLTSVERDLSAVQPRFAALVNPQAEVCDVSTVSAGLPAGATILQYAIGRTDLMCWAITTDGMVATHHTTGEHRIAALVGQVVDACATGGAYEQPATALADLLLAPFQEVIEKSRALLIVPAGPTLRLPFGVLPYGGRPLAEARPLVTLPSASSMSAPPADSPQDGFALVVGNPRAMSYRSAPVDDLPAAGMEAARVASLLPGARLLVEAAATRERVLELLPNSTIVHLATHGVLDHVNPLGSELLLADGTSLAAAELTGLPLGAELVVLSACRTGTGTVLRGEELLGFGRILLAGGAGSAVVTLWSVNDLSAALFMGEFHRRRAGGEPTGQALASAVHYLRTLTRDEARAAFGALTATASARRDVEAEEASLSVPFAHPYHWAPFVAVTARTATLASAPSSGVVE